jgi:hypothetical protein
MTFSYLSHIIIILFGNGRGGSWTYQNYVDVFRDPNHFQLVDWIIEKNVVFDFFWTTPHEFYTTLLINLVKLVIVTVAKIVESPFMCICNGRFALTGYCKIWKKDILVNIVLHWKRFLGISYLRQVNKAHSQGFKTKYSSCFISLSSLNHYLYVVSTSLQEMRVLKEWKNSFLYMLLYSLELDKTTKL